MTIMWLLEFGFLMVVALLGASGGWWLRGRFPQTVAVEPPTDRKVVAEQALQSLHAAAETVRSCVQQHIDCIQAIRSELKEASATEPAIINNAAASIIAANGLVQHQFSDIQRVLDSKKEELNDSLQYSDEVRFTFASLDRQRHVYRQVLSSLEVLAAELASEVKGHGQRLQRISDGLEGEEKRNAASITNAVTQIFDATDQMKRNVDSAEKRIEQQAETIQMQAILTHADLLTALPNRRALEAELQTAANELRQRGTICSVVFLDFDNFKEVNTQYGHHGGDVILRQASGAIKQLVRGKDLVARFGGDTLAILLHHTTLHDAQPIVEEVRKTVENTKFSHGNRPLRVTVSIGVAQLQRDETTDSVLHRSEQALKAAQQSGGNVCFRHDGTSCHPVSALFQTKREETKRPALEVASWWNEATPEAEPSSEAIAARHTQQGPLLSGKSLFAANLNRRLSEWKRGGPPVSVAVLQVDRMDDLVARFGPHAQGFLRQVLGRLLEAATRDMDERCEFEDGLFAILLPNTDDESAFAVADRLRSQVRQCKVRMGDDLWDLTASVGVAHCTSAPRVMDLIVSAETAMKQASRQGGDAICVGDPAHDSSRHTPD